MSSLISCDAVLNRSKILVPQGTSILLQFLVKIRPNLAKIHEDRTKTASQLINELTSVLHYITWLIGDGFRFPCLSSGDVWGLLLSCNEFDKLFKAELL